MSVMETAKSYLAAGLCVLPARRNEKRPALSGWKSYQSRLPSQLQVEQWFAGDPEAMCVVTGGVSGNLELIDFDFEGELFDAWTSEIPPELLNRLVIESSQSGGRHVIYRCEEPVCGNIKLAQDRREGQIVTLIETRGEGGLFLCWPTPGYELQQGSLTELPMLTPAERECLLEAAWRLNRITTEYVVPTTDAHGAGLRPGDDFNQRGDVRAVLARHGWQQVKGGSNEYWRRPGKNSGWSATLKDNVFFVFSGNAAPFESNKAYSPFAVYGLLEHGGDFAVAASALREEGYGDDSPIADIDLTQFQVAGDRAPLSQYPDPGPIPESLCRVPGFVSDVMDHCLATAPYPNVPLAFCGALALQALLAGRKVRDEADNRTNIYLLALAFSAVGKDWPRKLNTAILHQAGLIDALGEKFASGEGIQDALFASPAMLFQTDEIDGILQSINKSTDGRHESIMTTLLTMYSAANTIYPMRRKAGKEPPGVIDQPCLVLYGTAIPTHYYAALSERMLTNGFMARMLVVESGRRSCGQEPGLIDPSNSILDVARWWAEYRPGNGNLEDWHPEPRVVPATEQARSFLQDARREAEAEYARCESENDAVGTTIWGRVHEQTRKLALLYAISASHTDSEITFEAVKWARALVMHQTRRMLFMAEVHMAESPFHADCLRVMHKLRESSNHTISHSVLLKRMKMKSKDFRDLIETLVQRGDVQVTTTPGNGRPTIEYTLVGG